MIAINSVILIGRLTRDVELKYTQSGKAVTNFTLAVNRFKKDEADFINIVVWGKTAENCANYLAKGRLVAIDGRLQSRTYETNSGEKRYITEVVANNVKFLEWGEKEESSPQGNEFEGFAAMDSDEDIPF